MTGPLSLAGDAVRIRVVVQPRARRAELVGIHGSAVKIRLTAPPVDGRANEALIAFLARRLEVSPARVSIESGAASRRKTVRVAGIGMAQAEALLGLSPPAETG